MLEEIRDRAYDVPFAQVPFPALNKRLKFGIL
jgi:hypothetical protein